MTIQGYFGQSHFENRERERLVIPVASTWDLDSTLLRHSRCDWVPADDTNRSSRAYRRRDELCYKNTARSRNGQGPESFAFDKPLRRTTHQPLFSMQTPYKMVDTPLEDIPKVQGHLKAITVPH